MDRFDETIKIFATFANHIREAKSRNPNSDDVDDFITGFLALRQNFVTYDKLFLRAADYEDTETKEKVLDRQGQTNKQITEILRPILLAKLKATYGEVSKDTNPFWFVTDPLTINDYTMRYVKEAGITKEWKAMSAERKKIHPISEKATTESTKVENRIQQYFRTVAPFMLRKTMHHNLGVGRFSIETGSTKKVTRADVNGNAFLLNDTEDLNMFLSSKEVNGFPAILDPDFRFLFWTPGTGRANKMGVIDIDNPANIPAKDVRRAVKNAANLLDKRGHDYIIMFTGDNFQIWFGPSEEHQPRLGSNNDIQNYLFTIMGGIFAFKEEGAIANNMPLMDPSIYRDWGTSKGYTSPGNVQQIRMFFSLHYPADPPTDKTFSGLAAVPVSIADIEKGFDPTLHAHPEYVLQNFDAYSATVAAFFDSVKIGQDYDAENEIEAKPACTREEGRYPDHPLLDPLKTKPTKVLYEDITEDIDETWVLAVAKSKGMDAILHYDSSGKMKFDSKTIKQQRVIYTGQGEKQLITSPIRCVLITASGDVIHDDYLCRELERHCEKNKDLNTVTLVGQLCKADPLGNQMGDQAARVVVQRKEGIDVDEYRKLNFTVNTIANFNGDAVPIKSMKDTVDKFALGKIYPSYSAEIQAPVDALLKGMVSSLRKGRKLSTLLALGENDYEIVSTNTMQLTIVGVSKESKLYQSKSEEIPPVYVAAGKKSAKYGIVYHLIGKASIALKKADRIRLKELVYGEDDQYIIPISVRNDAALSELEFCEPSIVVNVSYDELLPTLTMSAATTFMRIGSQHRFRFLEDLWYSTPLVNARVTAIREDLSHRRLEDITHKQDPLIRIMKTAPKGLSLLDELPRKNPRTKKVRTNPAFHGVPISRQIILDAIPPPAPMFDDDGNEVQVPPVGGRKVEIPLIGDSQSKDPKAVDGAKYKGEFQRAHERWVNDEEGYRLFVDEGMKTGSPPHYHVTSLGSYFQDAVDDMYGYGADGSRIVTMDKTLDDTTWWVANKGLHYDEQIDSYHSGNIEQMKEDQKLVEAMLSRVPGGHDKNTTAEQEEPQTAYRSFSKKYQGVYKDLQEREKNALKKQIMGKKLQEEIKESTFPNPSPLKSKAWEYRVDEYVKEYERWLKIPEPKEAWERYAQGLFMLWEQPLLEKARMMRQATEQFSLSKEEADMVDSRFGAPPSNDDPLSPVLGDLFTTPEDFEYVDETETVE